MELVVVVRWRLLLTTLPIALAMVALTYLRRDVFHIPPLVEFTDLASTITGAALIIGFMYAGVMADYKESERLPGELASAIDAYGAYIDTLDITLPDQHGAPALRGALLDLVTVIRDWLMKSGPVAPCFAAIQTMNNAMANSAYAKGFPNHLIGGALSNTATVRRLVERINTIRVTRFTPAGYNLMWAIVVLVLFELVFASFKSEASQFAVVAAISLIFVYLVRLIADLDNPFYYANGRYSPESSEIDPGPILELHHALEERQLRSAG